MGFSSDNVKKVIWKNFLKMIKIKGEQMGNLDLNQEDNKVLEKKLADILLTLGISANLQGYHFLKESIRLVIENPNYIGAITKVMYPTVASRFKTTACRVERAIRHAIDVSYNKGKMIKINGIFGLKIFDDKEKPTNSEFVALLADKLSMELSL